MSEFERSRSRERSPPYVGSPGSSPVEKPFDSPKQDTSKDDFDAYVVITTHGSYEGKELENIIKHYNYDLNITKINATKLGVCNYLGPTSGDAIGKKIISQIKVTDPFIRSLQTYIASGKIDKPESSAEEIRDAIEKLDPSRQAALEKRVKTLYWANQPGGWDDDAKMWFEHVDRGYEIYNFKKQEPYLNKNYIVDIGEKLGGNHRTPFWNSITVINKNGEIIGDIIEMEHEMALIDAHDDDGNIKDTHEDTLLSISLNRVLDILDDSHKVLEKQMSKGTRVPKMNFKNVLLIDLSCSPTELSARTLRSVSRPGIGQIAQGTKRKKEKRKKTKKRRKKIKKNFH